MFDWHSQALFNMSFQIILCLGFCHMQSLSAKQSLSIMDGVCWYRGDGEERVNQG